MLALSGGAPVRTRPFPSWPVWDHTDEEALLEVLRSGMWGLGGSKVPEFENRFAAYHGAKYGVAACNGTVTLQVALTALGVGPGDEVIVPGYTFVATGAAVLHVGAIPVIVDIDPDTYNIDPEAVRSATTPRTKCIIPVHVGGNPADMDAIMALAEEHGIAVLEDAAQAHGARIGGRGVGSIGHIGSFSFQATKNLNAGEGGILITDDEELAALCRAYRNCGRFGGAREPVLGWDFRLTEFQAGLLLSQMNRLEEQTRRRDENGRYLAEQLRTVPGIRPLKRLDSVERHAYHLFIFRFSAEEWGVSLDLFIEALAAEGIPCSRGYVPLYRDPLFVTSGQSCPAAWPGLPNSLEQRAYRRMHLPNAERASEEAVWIPHYVLLGSRDDMDDVVEAVRKLYNHREALAKARGSGKAKRYAGLEG